MYVCMYLCIAVHACHTIHVFYAPKLHVHILRPCFRSVSERTYVCMHTYTHMHICSSNIHVLYAPKLHVHILRP